jgi:hypothetical protein
MAQELIHLYRIPGDNESQLLLKAHRVDILHEIVNIHTEYCYNIQIEPGEPIPWHSMI